MSQTSAAEPAQDQGKHGTVTVHVNTKPVTLDSHRVTGLEIKQAAIAQDVQIEEDFHLVLEATPGKPAREIGDGETITITDKSEFTANDGDDDS
jgi:Multiubiquitin